MSTKGKNRTKNKNNSSSKNKVSPSTKLPTARHSRRLMSMPRKVEEEEQESTRWKHHFKDDDSNFDENYAAATSTATTCTLSILARSPALVLNSDYQPLSYLPLSLWPWQRVMKSVFLGRVEILATYDDVNVRSATQAFALPSVICLKKYQQSCLKTPAFSRFNVFLRDDFRCQYCSREFRPSELTFDHVLPRSRGGRSTWSNIVACCMQCNGRKGNKTLKEVKGSMSLMKEPTIPTHFQLQQVAKKFPPKYLHETWMDYVYWDNPLQDEDDPHESQP
eukprot:CAMPEP_0185848494 /NCGR_PEP_ID=MMETSP1354-20130828/3347_1 /TAXON_ID=708628 /ORGANISM="Erythrolobus madagascarensis, Strain CCMP3276" /LENGTH=277 /DNA_ID=CAMNT_0028548897 /DNA_START=318 /DNA_END=1151 /DNA_ORIENTATION=+